MPVRVRILIAASSLALGLGAFLYAPYGGFLPVRNQLGVWAYNNGLEVPARLMFEVLSAREFAPATGNLGAMVFHGRGGAARDRPRAVRLMTQAAHRGIAPAQFNLGWAHELGHGTPADSTEARRWWERAAARDDLFAMMELASQLIPQDAEYVQDLLERSAALGETEALYGLAMNSEIICEADWDTCKEREIGYLRQASERGHVAAQAKLGIELSRGFDPAEAFQWSLRAADAGSFFGMRAVADAYYRGDGVQVDLAQAALWTERVALFQRPETGLVLPRDRHAVYIYRYTRMPRLAIIASHTSARMRIAEMYLQGIGVPRDPAKAVRFLRMAADDGDAEAPFRLAELYISGVGVERDREAARIWYGISAERGFEPARRRFEEHFGIWRR